MLGTGLCLRGSVSKIVAMSCPTCYQNICEVKRKFSPQFSELGEKGGESGDRSL